MKRRSLVRSFLFFYIIRKEGVRGGFVMMDSIFFSYIQGDFYLMFLAPLMSALFRAIFIYWYGPYKSWDGVGKRLGECFRFAFWWGMDFHAYVFLVLALGVSLPASIWNWSSSLVMEVKAFCLTLYLTLLYTAFLGKMIFYFHFRDTFNQLVWFGQNAEKKNLKAIFFEQHKGAWLLASYLPYMVICWWGTEWMLSFYRLPYPFVGLSIPTWVSMMVQVVLVVLVYYYFRYGGTLQHRNKPEWDTIPKAVKDDSFLAIATVDDFIALEKVWRSPLAQSLQKSEEDLWDSVQLVADVAGVDLGSTFSFAPFKRKALGSPLSSKPKHIFLIVGESYAQNMLDEVYADLHVADKGKAFSKAPGVWYLPHVLPAGINSRPAICGLMTGLFDGHLEINESSLFWEGTVPFSLPLQMKRLGYRTEYWYGGDTRNGNYSHFCPGQGFDAVHSGTEFCGPEAPRTWVGVYDHIFLEKTAELMAQEDTDEPVFHFVYTTSNHGPYTIPIEAYGYDVEKVMPDAPKDVKENKELQKGLGTHWYSDQALFSFVETIKERYEDALIIITSDHSHFPGDLPKTSFLDREYTIREGACVPLFVYHRELQSAWFAGNRIAGHMNIMPTLMELLSPKGFEYYSMFPSLFTSIDWVVTPYHWLTKTHIGRYKECRSECIGTEGEVLTEKACLRFDRYSEAYADVTAYVMKHSTLLQSVAQWMKGKE